MNPRGSTNKFNFQTLLLVLTVLFLLIEKILIPTVNSGKLADEVHQQAVAVGRLQEAIRPLAGLPTQVATIEAMLKTHVADEKEKR